MSNPQQQNWPQAEAERMYFSTARDLAAEFKLTQLGAGENSVDINARELRLKK